jgi:outer membrane protein OmpU
MKNNGGLESSIFATTALVAFAGAAAADVTISGSAEMGFATGNNQATTTFHQSVDVRFSMSGTTDNGLSFGAVVDLDDVGERGTAGTGDIAGAFADFTVFVSGDFGRLTMGDTDGAFDFALDDVNTARNAGSINDAETGHAGYNGNGMFDGIYNGQILRYDYSVAGFGVAVSAELDQNDGRSGDTALQLGLTYDLDIAGGEIQFGLGYFNVDDANRRAAASGANAAAVTAAAGGNVALAGDQGFSAIGVSVLAALDMGFSAAVNYTEVNDDGFFGGDGEHTAIGLGYNFDAITVSANYGQYDWATLANQSDREGYGLAARYDLGGGLTAHLGYGEGKVTAANASGQAVGRVTSTFSLGLAMAF